MKIAVYGLAKTGTTALFYKIKSSLPQGAICLFEPRSLPTGALLHARLKALRYGRLFPDVLAKVLAFRPNAPAETDDFASFDKHILIVRDPRDRLISHLLYRAFRPEFAGSEAAAHAFISRVKAKERDPRSVSLSSLIRLHFELIGPRFAEDEWRQNYAHHAGQVVFDFHDKNPHLHLFRYEDLVQSRFAGLESYLGIELKGSPTVDAGMSRVVRTKSYGGWRDWFIQEDIAFFAPILQPYLDRYYPKADWALNPAPRIPASHGSEYVKCITNEMRRSMGLPEIRENP